MVEMLFYWDFNNSILNHCKYLWLITDLSNLAIQGSKIMAFNINLKARKKTFVEIIHKYKEFRVIPQNKQI